MTSSKSAQTARRLYKKIMNVVPRHEKYYPFQQTTNFGLSLISYPRNLPLFLSLSLCLSLPVNNIRLNSVAQSPSLSHEVAMAVGLYSDFDSILSRLMKSWGYYSLLLWVQILPSCFQYFCVLDTELIEIEQFRIAFVIWVGSIHDISFFLNSFLILWQYLFPKW